MLKKLGLAGIASAVLLVANQNDVEARTKDFYGCMPAACAPVRMIDESVCNDNSVYYNLNCGRGSTKKYSVYVNNDVSCRLIDVDKVYIGDTEVQLNEINSRNQFAGSRTIPVACFLNRNTKYRISVVDSCGKERALDEVKPGDRGLRFYPVKDSGK